jgi:hypothetical protein
MHFIEVLVVMVNERDILERRRGQWQKMHQKLPMFISDRFLPSRARTQTPPLQRQERPHFQYDEQERS